MDLETIFRLSCVDAAKKRIPPIAAKNLLAISNIARAMPAVEKATTKHIEQYLNRGLIHRGAGIPTLICMLSVETKGKYPPMDRKFAAGLRAQRKVNDVEHEALNGADVSRFAKVYVAKAIPAWLQSTQARSPEDADNYWGRGGKDDD